MASNYDYQRICPWRHKVGEIDPVWAAAATYAAQGLLGPFKQCHYLYSGKPPVTPIHFLTLDKTVFWNVSDEKNAGFLLFLLFKSILNIMRIICKFCSDSCYLNDLKTS
jgi:hypothetical protein